MRPPNKAIIERLTNEFKVLKKTRWRPIVSSEIDRLYMEQGAVNLNASTGSDPDCKLLKIYRATAVIAHSYRRTVIGWPSNMRFFDIAYMKKFLRNSHAPNDTVIVVGDIQPDGFLNLVEKYFGWLMHEGSTRGRLVTTISLNRIQRDDLIRFHNLFYHPEDVMISISDDIDRKEAVTLIKRYFSVWQPTEEKVETPSLPQPQQ
jgi:predicted Zn-dependent peptidase